MKQCGENQAEASDENVPVVLRGRSGTESQVMSLLSTRGALLWGLAAEHAAKGSAHDQ